MKVTVGILVCFLLATLATSLSLRRSNVRSGQGKTTPSELHGVMPRLDKNISKAGPKLKLFGAVPKGSVKMKTPISHGKCVKIAAPKVCTGTEDFYYGTVGSHVSKSSVKEISEGISKIFDLLPMVSVMLKPEDQAKFQKCLPSMSNLVCHSLLPRCNLQCQQMKPCQSACATMFNGCIPKDAIKDIGKVRSGGSYRPMILGAIGAAEGSPVMTVVDSILDSLSDPTCSSPMYSKATNRKLCLGDEYEGGTCGDPVPVDIRAEIAKKTHDNMMVLKRRVNDSAVHKDADETEKKVYQKLNVKPEKSENITSKSDEEADATGATGATGEAGADQTSGTTGTNAAAKQTPTAQEIEASIITKAKAGLNATKPILQVDAVNTTEENALQREASSAEKLAKQTLGEDSSGPEHASDDNEEDESGPSDGIDEEDRGAEGKESEEVAENKDQVKPSSAAKSASVNKMASASGTRRSDESDTDATADAESGPKRAYTMEAKKTLEGVQSIDQILISQRRAKEEDGNAHWQWVGGAGFGSFIPRHHQKLAKQQKVVPFKVPQPPKISKSSSVANRVPVSDEKNETNRHAVKVSKSLRTSSTKESKMPTIQPAVVATDVETKNPVNCGNTTCDSKAHCEGSECTCNPGYTGNGKKCVADHMYDATDDGQDAKRSEPTPMQKGFGRVVAMEKKKAKDLIEEQINKAENYIDKYQSQMSDKIHKVEEEMLDGREDESGDTMNVRKPSPKELLVASVIKSEKGKAKAEIKKQMDKAERFIKNYEDQLADKISKAEKQMDGATGTQGATGMTGARMGLTGSSTGSENVGMAETGNAGNEQENAKKQTFNNLIGFAVSKTKKKINEGIADALMYMDKYTSKLLDTEKQIERELTLHRESRNETENENEYVKPYFPTDREKAAASVAHVAAEAAKTSLQKELNKAYKILGVESGKLSNTLEQTKLELDDIRSKPEDDVDSSNDNRAEDATGATGTGSAEEEPTTFTMSKRKATAFVMDTLTQKGKTYLANLVDKASDLIDKNVIKGQVILKKVMHEMNESRTERSQNEGTTEQESPHKQTAQEKTIGNFVHTAAEQVKAELTGELEKAYNDMNKYEGKLQFYLTRAGKEIRRNSIERLKNETLEEQDEKMVTEAEAEKESSTTNEDPSSGKKMPKCQQVNDIPGCSARTFMATYDQTFSIKKYRSALNEFFGALPILATLSNEDHQFVSECLPEFHKHACNIIFPKCTEACEVQLPCTSSCHATGKCQKLFDKSFLGSLVKGGDHYDIMKTITSADDGADKDSIEIIGMIVEKFTTKCGKPGVYAPEGSTDTCSDIKDAAVRKCTNPVDN